MPQLFLFQSVLNPTSVELGEINKLFGNYALAAAILLLFVSALVVYIRLRFRDKKENPVPRQISKNNRLEVLMFPVPTILVLSFFILTVRTIHRVIRPGEGQSEVIITGRQYWAGGVSYGTEINCQLTIDN